jgi:hypothetical protein
VFNVGRKRGFAVVVEEAKNIFIWTHKTKLVFAPALTPNLKKRFFVEVKNFSF